MKENQERGSELGVQYEIEREMQANPKFATFAAANEIWSNEMMRQVGMNGQAVDESQKLIDCLISIGRPRPVGFYGQMKPHYENYRKGYSEAGRLPSERRRFFMGLCNSRMPFARVTPLEYQINLRAAHMLSQNSLAHENLVEILLGVKIPDSYFHAIEEHTSFVARVHEEIIKKYLS